jgi:hypothetical protein
MARHLHRSVRIFSECEVVMAKEDRRCAFCGKEILWNEEFSMENGQEFHVAPLGCWAEYLKTKAHQERDGEDR